MSLSNLLKAKQLNDKDKQINNLKSSITNLSIKEVEKAYQEGIYSDTPVNRKLGRVGMTYTAYSEYTARKKEGEDVSIDDFKGSYDSFEFSSIILKEKFNSANWFNYSRIGFTDGSLANISKVSKKNEPSRFKILLIKDTKVFDELELSGDIKKVTLDFNMYIHERGLEIPKQKSQKEINKENEIRRGIEDKVYDIFDKIKDNESLNLLGLSNVETISSYYPENRIVISYSVNPYTALEKDYFLYKGENYKKYKDIKEPKEVTDAINEIIKEELNKKGITEFKVTKQYNDINERKVTFEIKDSSFGKK